MDGICAQCHEYITETDQCLCTHAIHSSPEMFCPWCGLDDHERAEVLDELNLDGAWEVLWIGHNYAGHRPGCGPVYGLRGTERSFAYCFGCHADLPFEPEP
jgi:hypothetical protein